MTTLAYKVFFLCTGNSARSILAESLLNHWGARRFRAYSAGSFPTGRVNPLALELLAQMKIPADDARSKSWDEFAAPGAVEFDFIITVCDNAAQSCPAFRGQAHVVHRAFDDPPRLARDATSDEEALGVLLSERGDRRAVAALEQELGARAPALPLAPFIWGLDSI